MGYQGQILWDKAKPDGTPKKQLDISRMKALGWSSKISLESGIKQAVADYSQSLTNSSLRL